jgi:hypothetical protein
LAPEACSDFTWNNRYVQTGRRSKTTEEICTCGTANIRLRVVLFQTSPGNGRLDWWLAPTEQGWQSEFSEHPTSEESVPLACHNVSLGYDWRGTTPVSFWAPPIGTQFTSALQMA